MATDPGKRIEKKQTIAERLAALSATRLAAFISASVRSKLIVGPSAQASPQAHMAHCGSRACALRKAAMASA